MKQFAFDDKIVPKFVDPGLYKGEIIAYKKNSDVASSMVTFIARLY